jgi:prepilin-type N-terminal cleavage/methylation domain-containing protein
MLKNKTKRNKKIEGFTMIELLMVMAVIALLVAIVFISLTVVRTKAGNSVIKNDVDQLRKYAEVMYTENGMRGYCVSSGTESCFEQGNVRLNELEEDIRKRNDQELYPSLFANADNFCISTNLSDNSFYCLDSKANQTAGDGSGSPSGTCTDILGPNYIQCQ